MRTYTPADASIVFCFPDSHALILFCFLVFADDAALKDASPPRAEPWPAPTPGHVAADTLLLHLLRRLVLPMVDLDRIKLSDAPVLMLIWPVCEFEEMHGPPTRTPDEDPDHRTAPDRGPSPPTQRGKRWGWGRGGSIYGHVLPIWRG